MLTRLLKAFGPSGAEEAVRELIRPVMEKLCDQVRTDSIGNLICLKKGTKGYRNSIMLTSHMDEVGLIVSGHTKEGYLRFKAVGGIDPRVLVAKRVLIGDKRLPGVIGDKPPHLSRGEKKKALTISELYIDIGAQTEEEAQNTVSPGDFAVFDSEPVHFGNDLIKGKALDDRIGCSILMELAKNRYPHDVYYVFTVQEEVGCRGAAVAANVVCPDAAIVVEGTTCSDVPKTQETGFSTRMGKGAAISIFDRGSYSDVPLRNALYKAAQDNQIPVQYKQTAFGGNDAAAIHVSGEGIRTAVISVPCRYIHSPASVASLKDIESATDILDAFLKREAKEEWSF